MITKKNVKQNLNAKIIDKKQTKKNLFIKNSIFFRIKIQIHF